MYTEERLKSLPKEINSSGKILCDILLNKHRSMTTSAERIKFYDSYVSAFAILEAILISKNYQFEPPIFKDDKTTNIAIISDFFYKMLDEFEKKLTTNAIEVAREKYRTIYDAKFSYRFSDGDLKRIQELINELREYITTSEIIDANHKERLLNKLEDLQKEVHKKMSSLDKFWGLIGEAGVVLGKFGKDIKPLVDRIKEITLITWQTQARSEELPSGTPLALLAPPSKNEELT